MNKRNLFLLCLALFGMQLFAAKKTSVSVPEWLSNHESTPMFYRGVGSAAVSDADYLQKAEEEALLDLARQIAVTIKSESSIQMVNSTIGDSETFTQKTQLSLVQYMEGQHLVGSYTDQAKGRYYVCYQLNKPEFDQAKAKKSKEIAAKGYDYLTKGRNALSQGELFRGLDLFSKGFAEVEPWLFLPLNHAVNGSTVCVPAELYQAISSVYDGLQLSAVPTSVQAQTFTAINEPITVSLTRQGTPIPNAPITAAFASGSGTIEPQVRTNSMGQATFHLTRVIGKQTSQSLRFSLGQELQNEMAAIKQYLSSQTMPETTVMIQVGSQTMTAYLSFSQMDLPAAKQQIENILVANHFNVAPETDGAELFIDIKCSMELGGTVPGELYDLNECLVSLQMQFYNSRTEQLITTYSLPSLRVLCPQTASYEQTVAQCTREMMKRVRTELPRTLKQINK